MERQADQGEEPVGTVDWPAPFVWPEDTAAAIVAWVDEDIAARATHRRLRNLIAPEPRDVDLSPAAQFARLQDLATAEQARTGRPQMFARYDPTLTPE